MPKPESIPLGIVLRKSPARNNWVRWAWRVTALLPGAGGADWVELRREGDVTEWHAATLQLELWRTDTEAYLSELSSKVPSVYVVLREEKDPIEEVERMEPVLATASPYEAQDYLDGGDGIVDAAPMPAGLIALVREFCERHHVEQAFVKRVRDKKRVDLRQDGVGDPRIRQLADVYRAPGREPGAGK